MALTSQVESEADRQQLAKLRRYVDAVPAAFDPPTDILLDHLAHHARNWVRSQSSEGSGKMQAEVSSQQRGQAVRSQKSEVRSPQSEVRSPQSEVRSPQSAVRSPQSPVRSQKSAVSRKEQAANVENGLRGQL